MKKAERNGENSSSGAKKSFGLQLSENDVSSSVLGGIVEKGFNKQVSQPQVTVLPFPVARHRSHGPHWAPRTSSLRTHGKDEEDDGEDEDHTNFDLAAAYANPIQRKQKKGLDFRHWQELMNGNNTSEFSNKREHKFDDSAKPSDLKKGSGSTISKVVKRHEEKIGEVGIDDVHSNFDDGMRSTLKAKDISENVIGEAREEIMVDMGELNTPASRMHSNSRSVDAGIEQGSTSMESEIDAENRAQLEKMSTDEIAEAQAEIMKKMNPALIKILQKRGQDKMRKKSESGSAICSIGKVVDEKAEKESISATLLPESDNAQNMIVRNPNRKQTGLESKDLPEVKSSASSLWDAWSTNVEAARDLRFSLDGDVMTDCSQVPGNASAMGVYSGENASQRDFLRTEGDPGALGYTIKEALALTRSVVPGQRALALHLLASVLYKAQDNIRRNQTGSTLKTRNQNKIVDWEALWAFALGPEPELALSLRICLDDNHNSVVIACARVIQCVLSYDFNELFFDISEKTGIYEKDVCTAPIFRSRPKIDVGFLHGGFWKYNTKPSNLFPFDNTLRDDEAEDEHTIKDDVVVAIQDIAAGLVRMGILPRIRYLLESDPSAALEECLISILVAIARHSPTCADAIMKCERLVQVIVHRFTTKDQMGVDFSKIKSVILVKVLARSERKRCMEFVDNGIFRKMISHLYRYAFSLDHWLNIDTEKFKLSSALLVEQLRFWKVCIQYGYCVSYFSDLFPALYIWLDVPTFDKLIGKNILHEFISITKEAYLVLEALTRTLPNFYSHSQKIDRTTEEPMNDTETWCWNHVGPMIDLALKWISLKSDTYLFNLISPSKGNFEELTSMLWVISAVMHMLFGVLKNVIPEDNSSILGGNLPWLPEFVPKIGLHIIKNGLLNFTQVNKPNNRSGTDCVGSFLEFLCQYRHQSDQETSLASACCLNGLVKVVVSVNKLIQLANTEVIVPSIEPQSLASADKILTDGILKCSMSEMTTLLTSFMKLTSSGQLVQSVEMFGRGGPAPGVGVGWGASGGGFWSTNILVAQMDARLVLQLLEIFLVEFAKENPTNEELNVTMERVNCAFNLCLLMGPKDGIIMDKVLDILLQPQILKCLDLVIRRSLDLNNLKTFGWQYMEEEYLMFSENLISHFKNRWLHVKKSKAKLKTRDSNHGTSKKSKFSLDTIQEDVDTSRTINSTSLVTEWAHQRLPLPDHWFLSPVSTVDYTKVVNLPVEPNFPEVARCGLFFLLGLEAMSSHISSYSYSSIQSVPVIWKLHALSVTLFAGMNFLEEEKTRDVYINLQELYGQLLDKKLSEMGRNNSVDFLKFDKEIHDSYSTFVETHVENFAGVSYGDLLYGRQIAMYLHRCVGAPIRLAAWNALSNVRALELLPPLEQCLAQEEGYLEPLEDDETILEAYVKSWVSGALDRSVTRKSVAFTLVIHHVSYFIFGYHAGDRISLRKKLAKSILRDYSRKPEHEDMMVKLMQYKKPTTSQKLDPEEDLSLQGSEIAKKLTVLREACDENSTLLSVVEKLKNAIPKQR
ncbi:transcriptional elongation regulator MINIYO isoform X1 [Cynara cardunculus var. scolymus]|uniref:Armadillo-type fold n=1 Tax=Cynara cardunculus var. scolymus TaxID=59895 RepID=A0A103XC64_CYNCS|nr:transcriptional elongation regulator MINIYO isoform X1 [Cynara cardunculus var. scolymus]XP_024962474.1 transcriptional elongation regulator MINIYO isoform X1 [Cynara cardunculus var. scolymus]KVH88004.1 Armadillo-type fold [Cynara cardunculus var. scolymus]